MGRMRQMDLMDGVDGIDSHKETRHRKSKASKGMFELTRQLKAKRRRIVIGGISAIILYIAIYGWLYYHRKPAGDLAYWDYTGPGPMRADDCLYYAFYPVYIIHQRVFHCQRHIKDFHFAEIPDDFPG